MQKSNGRRRTETLVAISLYLLFPCAACTEPLTLPLDERPNWAGRDGIVMAGSWEPLLFRVRRDGSEGYEPTDAQRAAYAREHSPDMVERLKALGVNFVMMHCYKGGGLATERESMADAVRFAQQCHDAGIRAGVYNYSGAFIWELFFKEMPSARDWVLLNEKGEPEPYGAAAYRQYWNRNHPDAQAFYREIVRFAIEEIQADLIHFDNYSHGPGSDAQSVQRFREYLRDSFSPEQLTEMGVVDVGSVRLAMSGPPDNMLRRAWLDFSAQSLSDSYHDMSQFARTLRKDILVECNPGGPGAWIGPGIDHGRLLQGGEAYWDEGEPPGYRDGVLQTRIRTYKIARRMDNMAFAYATTPLEMAESMAFNLDCLGCVCWFEYGDIVKKPGSKDPMSPELARFIRFFHERRDLLRDADALADVAVLRSYSSQVFADPRYPALTARVEQALVENPACFQIVYDCHLEHLERYQVLVLAGCVALSNRQVGLIKQYVHSGGGLCIIGPAATHDEWMREREHSALDDLPASCVVRIGEEDDVIDGINRTCTRGPSLSVRAAPGLCAELTEQPGRCLVHLVNYRADGPVRDAAVRVRLPDGRRGTAVTLASPEREQDVRLPLDMQGQVVTFTVPEVSVYEIAVVATE